MTTLAPTAMPGVPSCVDVRAQLLAGNYAQLEQLFIELHVAFTHGAFSERGLERAYRAVQGYRAERTKSLHAWARAFPRS